MIKRCSLIIVYLISLTMVNVGAQEERVSPSPTPSSDHNLNIYHFPTSLYCQDINILSGAGPVWQGIQISFTELKEFQAIVLGLSEEYETSGLRGTSILYSISDPNESDQLGVPLGIRACVIDNLIWLVQVSVITDDPNQRIFIDDILAEYGEPDVVTWSELLATRLAFWFEQGLVAEFVVADLVGSSKGEIFNLIYIPYQDADEFRGKWPFNQTRTTPPSSGDAPESTPLPVEQNPFDFDAMIATITAQPSRTPTATPTLSVTEVPATATPHS